MYCSKFYCLIEVIYEFICFVYVRIFILQKKLNKNENGDRETTLKKLHSFEKAGMEILSIGLKVSKSTWLELYNVYLPNTSTQYNSFSPSLIKPGPSSFIFGDFSGHSQMWDSFQPQH